MPAVRHWIPSVRPVVAAHRATDRWSRPTPWTNQSMIFDDRRNCEHGCFRCPNRIRCVDVGTVGVCVCDANCAIGRIHGRVRIRCRRCDGLCAGVYGWKELIIRLDYFHWIGRASRSVQTPIDWKSYNFVLINVKKRLQPKKGTKDLLFTRTRIV